MRKVFFLLVAFLCAATIVKAQSSANYSFTTNNDGSLSVDLNSNTIDMSSGTTQLVGPGLDATASSVTNIGFDFYFMGTRFTQFSVNEDGVMQLGGTVVGTNTYSINLGTPSAPRLAAFNADMRTGTTTGKIHYKVVGAAPNRTLVVEFTDMQLFYTFPGVAGSTRFQMRLYETSGRIEYVYGAVNATVITGTTDRNPSVGFYTGSATGAFASVAYATQTNSTTSPYTANPTVPVGVITALNSATDGSRRYYRYTPPQPAAPTTLSFTGVSAGGMTLNWVDNSNSEYNFAVLRSTDNINFTQVATVASTSTAGTGTAYTSTQLALSPSTTYYWKVVAVSEGGFSSALSGTQATSACGGLAAGTYAVGPTGAYTSLTAAAASLSGGTLGPVTFELQSTYNSSVETFPIVFAAAGCPIPGVTVRPQSGATALTVSGSSATTIIDINGANYLTIDGRPGGVGAAMELAISNTNTAGSAIRFINDANSNTIKYTTVTGVTTSTSNGVILFSTTSGTNGNDNNTIDNCIIKDGATTPSNAIYASGTTTTTATNNSGNIISNNRISNYFAAGSASSGVNISGGNTDWTITNNKFFQTAARTQTSGTQHSAINISNTSGNNFQVTGNTIGYANESGTGTYTFGIVGSSTFIPIALSVGTTTATSVQGNTITAIAISGSGSGTNNSAPFRAIYVASGLAYIGANSAGVPGTGNTIGSQTATGAITYTSSSASASDVIGVFNFGSSAWIVANNNIGGITASNSSSGAANVYGIRWNTSSSVTTLVQNNIVGGTVANSMQSTSAATGSQVAGIFSNNASTTASNNTIRNLTAAGGTGTTTAASVVGISFSSSSVNNIVTQNTIHSLSNTNTTAATTVTGIQYTATTGTNVIARNNLHSFSAASATAIVNGIQVSGGTSTYQNNMIRLGYDATGTALSTGMVINGIIETSGTDNFYFNSVYVGGTGVAGTVNTFAFNSSVTSNTRNFQNNIFWNARSNGGGTGKHYAVRVGGTSANPAGLTSNYNDIYATGTGGITGLFNSVDQATLAAWRTATGQDAGSIAGDPQFINATGSAATGDLHIHASNPSVIEAAGLPIAAVTDDFDGQARAGLTPTDIGADAGNFVMLDISLPLIVYTPLGGTLCNAIRPLTATITDGSGINVTAGTKPRVWFKKSTNANVLPGTNDNTTDGWKYSEATNNTSPFTFNIDASQVFGGVAAGDIIQYFVVAQDLATTPNVSINSGSFATAATSVALSSANFPIGGTINSYTVGTGGISGTVTIGAAGTYPTLTGAGGLFATLNAGGLSGNVTAEILDPTIAETGANSLNAISYGCAGNFTLTIKPAAGVTTVLSGSSNTALINLNGADFVTIDGSNSGGTATGVGGNAALRNLTIQNTSTTATAGTVIAIMEGSDGSQNVTLKNIAISGQDPTQTLLGVHIGGNSVGSAPTINNNNIVVENCSFAKSIIAIFDDGVSALNPGTGHVIRRNDISATGANRMRRAGIFLFNHDGIQVTENKIGGIVADEAADAIGIIVGIQNVTTTSTTSGGIKNSLIANNVIAGIESTNTTGFSAVGIAIAGDNGNNIIANNMISGVIAPSTSPDLTAGIFIAGVAGSSTSVYNNTIYMSGNRGSISSQIGSFGIAISGTTDPTVDIRNNIVYSTQTSGGGTNAKSFLIATASTTFANLTSNYNTLVVTGANAAGFRSGDLGTGGTDYATLNLWQTATGKDANSLTVTPTFVSATNLHLSTAAGTNWCLNAAGISLPSVTTDIDGDTRGTPKPDIGADEFVPTGFVVNNPAAVCSPATVDLTDGAITSGSIGGLTFTYFTDAAGTTTLANPSAVSASGTYYIKATSGSCSVILPVVVTINTLPGTFNVTGGGSVCVSGGSPVAIGLSGSETGVNYQLVLNGSTNVGSAVPGSGTSITFGTHSTLGTYTVVATNATTSCTATMTGSAVIANYAPLNITNTTTQPTTCVSSDGAIDLTVTGTAGPFTYTWTTVGGSGLTPGAQDQTGLTVGQYTVVVTDQSNGCQQAPVVFNLVGPGSCATCPVIGSVATNPTSTTCVNTPVTITASGLVSMGVTYGIRFVTSPTPLADPYTGGTVIGTVVNGSLTGGGTSASITTSALPSGNNNIYAILSPTPIDPACRPSSNVYLLVGTTTSVDNVSNQVVCNNSNTAAVNFTSPVGGTTFTWTNNTTSIGLGANGSGNIPSFVATNAGTAPVTATITVTPSITTSSNLTVSKTFTYTGAAQSWVVPAGVTSVRITAKGAAGGTVTGNGGPFDGGRGATMAGDFAVTPGQTLDLIVGGKGNPDPSSSGGGGGTGVNRSGTALIVAGGGAGIDFQDPGYANRHGVTTTSGQDGNGNAGSGGTAGGNGGDYAWTPDDISRGGKGWNAGAGGTFGTNGTSIHTTFTNGTWGLGGGGGSVGYGWCNCGAGGGGYSGGGSAYINASGGGGGSLNTGTNQNNIAGDNTGDGEITIQYSTAFTTTCTGTPKTFTITVNPTPTVDVVSNQTLCNGSSTAAVNFTGAVSGTVYNWTNNTTSIGLGASGTGNIPTFVATNAGTAPVTATITVTPSYTNGSVTCNGTPRTFTITVNPTPTVNAVSNQTLCNGSSTAAVNFTGAVSGTVYNWTNNTTSIGLGASGTGNIPTFVATNTGTAPVTATITVTPSYTNGSVTCNGTPRTFTITVNPTPNAVATPSSQTICSGTAITTIVLTSGVSGTTYTWTRNNTGTVTGIAASGSGNISGTLTNTAATPTTVTFTITPTANGCPGTPITATVTVQQALSIVCPANITAPNTPTACGATVSYTPTINGTPAPTVGYVFSGATTGSGSGTGSGSVFNVGVTTVTLTATNSCGTATCSFTVTVTDTRAPVITTQPASRSFCENTNATFSVVATNGASYQWQQFNGTSFVNITGATTSTLTIPSVTPSMNTNTFRVIVTGPCGSTVTSNAVTLGVYRAASVTIVASPPSILPNQTATLTAVVNNGLGSFVWSYNGSVLPGQTGPSVGPLFATAAGTYRVVYTDPNGCVATSADQSLTAIVSDVVLVYPNPNFGQFHVRYYNAANEKATINVYNPLGQRVYRKEFTTAAPYTQLDVDLGFKANGVYTVEIVDGSGNIRGTKRLLVNKN